jgi:putative endonuclease
MARETHQQLNLGTHGEQLVQAKLVKDGFTILQKNMRIQGGEIDLIAQKDDLLICVEVKTRTCNANDMAELITPWQQQRIIRAAKQFITSRRLDMITCRFDVALIAIEPTVTLTYIADAFQERS